MFKIGCLNVLEINPWLIWIYFIVNVWHGLIIKTLLMVSAWILWVCTDLMHCPILCQAKEEPPWWKNSCRYSETFSIPENWQQILYRNLRLLLNTVPLPGCRNTSPCDGFNSCWGYWLTECRAAPIARDDECQEQSLTWLRGTFCLSCPVYKMGIIPLQNWERFGSFLIAPLGLRWLFWNPLWFECSISTLQQPQIGWWWTW